MRTSARARQDARVAPDKSDRPPSDAHTPTTADIIFICVIVLSFLLLTGGLLLGLGLGSACTDIPGNGGLHQAPCNRVDHGIKMNTALQAALFIAPWVIGGRLRSRRWLAWTLLLASVAAFAVSMTIASSYQRG
jgi:hypothetical protein